LPQSVETGSAATRGSRARAGALLRKAQFAFGAAALSQLPLDEGAEVAFAGRSNAGKSSAINALTNRRKLAFVSKTPGRTQQINYYALDANRYLVDLPGYGYAKAPGGVQLEWQRFLGAYLQTRRSLRGLVVIMDARHPLTPLDARLLEWFAPSGKPVHVLLSKADKLTRQEQAKQLREVKAALAAHHPNSSAQLFSSVSRLGLEQALAFVEGLLCATPEAVESAPGEKKSPRLKGKTGG
jgi:GTP-binding protein